MKEKIKVVLNSIFILGFITTLIVFSIYVLFIKTQRSISEVENRYLKQTIELEDTQFSDQSFQKDLDLVLSDQFLFRYNIVKFKKRFDFTLDLILFPVDSTLLKLTAVSEDGKIMRLGTSDYMIGKPMMYEERIQERVPERIKQYNELASHLVNTEVYVYHPTQPHETSLFDYYNELDSYGPTVESFFDELDIPYSALNVDNIDSLMDDFYSSDHHWSNHGSYQGYKDILNLLDPTLVPLSPTNEKCGLKFEGTYSTRTGYVLGPSDFCVYQYNLKPYTVSVDGKEITTISDTNYFYTNYDTYDKGLYYYNFAYDRYEKYGSFVTYSSGVNTKKILVVGDSYMPPVLPLLAQHYGTVYALYPVEYNAKNEAFDYYHFLENNSIDKVVFMTTIENYFFDDEYGDRYKLFDISPTWGN